MKQYAVNIGDMTRDIIISQCLLAPYIDRDSRIKAEKTMDGGAVLLNCDEETVNNIIAVIRMKYSKHIFRFYVGSKKTWKRI